MTVVSREGLRLEFLPSVSSLEFETTDRLRVCVPNARSGQLVARADSSAQALPVRFPEVCIIPQGRQCTLQLAGSSSMVMLELDSALFEQAVVESGTSHQLQDCLVQQDAYLRRVGGRLEMSFREGSSPDGESLAPLAREIARHLASAYAGANRIPKRRTGLAPARLGNVLKAIDEGLHTPLTTATLAQHAACSEFHFCRMFRASTGYSAHGYVTLRRMDRARELLREGNLSLREITQAVGYKTQAHFTSVFHTQCGVTPAAYRRSFADKSPGK